MSLISKRVSQLYYSVTGVLGKRKEDIFLVSFPKSGNTWVKFLLLNILINNKELDRNISFKILDETIPELGRDNLLTTWKFTSLPRFIKSHLSYKKIFFGNNRSLLIIRNPKDVMVSYFHYVKNSYGYQFEGNFAEFIRSKRFGLEACLLHQISWQNKASVSIKFEELKTSKAGNLLSSLRLLGIQVNEEIFRMAVDDSSFDNMKKLEKGPKRYDIHKPDYNFVRKGTSNQWSEYFDENDLAYYNSLLKKYKSIYIDYYAEG